MRKHWIVVMVGCLILGFQNCSQSGLVQTDLASSNLSIVAPVPGSMGDSSSEESTSVDAVLIPSPEGTLTVESESGKISLVDQNNQVLEEACLGSQELSELQSYLKSYNSNLCGAPAVSSETMCAQSYTKGYASLIIGDQKMNLGERFDSCGRGFKDFCGDQAQSFRGLVVYIQKNFHSLNCQ